MKKSLSFLVVLAIALGVVVVNAQTKTESAAAATKQASPELTAKATEVCTSKGLTGTQLDECVKTETAKLEKEQAAKK
ncbi:MAG: hypothetical protein ABH859_04980 [Pseudomonadota bacterium]